MFADIIRRTEMVLTSMLVSGREQRGEDEQRSCYSYMRFSPCFHLIARNRANVRRMLNVLRSAAVHVQGLHRIGIRRCKLMNADERCGQLHALSNLLLWEQIKERIRMSTKQDHVDVWGSLVSVR